MSDTINLDFIEATVRIDSSLALSEVGNVLSEHLFGGIAFVSTDEFDELAGLRLSRPMLGMYATIIDGGAGAFTLKIRTDAEPFYHLHKKINGNYIYNRICDTVFKVHAGPDRKHTCLNVPSNAKLSEAK